MILYLLDTVSLMLHVMLEEIKECSRESDVEHVNSSKIRFFDLNIDLFRCIAHYSEN